MELLITFLGKQIFAESEHNCLELFSNGTVNQKIDGTKIKVQFKKCHNYVCKSTSKNEVTKFNIFLTYIFLKENRVFYLSTKEHNATFISLDGSIVGCLKTNPFSLN